MVLTLGIAFGIRPFMPRFIGNEAFGLINYADAFTSTVFALTGLGIDTYIRKEVSVRPEHASEFFPGVTALRLVMALVLTGGVQLFLVATHRPPETWLLVHLYGLGAFLLTLNQSFAALLHAKGTVDELSLLNIASKLIWAGGTVLTIVLHWPLFALALSVVAAELVKATGSVRLVSKYLRVTWAVQPAAVKMALLSSLPIFLNVAAHTIYNKLDVTLLEVVASPSEVGWYSTSSMIAGMALYVSPIIGWVLLPLFAKARARSDEEYTQVMRRSLELVLVIAFPTSLFIGLGAEELLHLFNGSANVPPGSLRILASIFVLTYIAMLSANALILTGRAWAQAGISMLGLVVNPLLNWLLIERCLKAFGEGGAGIGAAWSQLGTEVVVTTAMTLLVGRRAFDRRSLVMIAKTLAVVGVVIALDWWLHGHQWPSVPRLALDVAAYLVLVVALRAVHVKETVDFARAAFKRKNPNEAASPQNT